MPSTVKRQSAAVMFTDIAGYTSIMASDEEKALSLLQEKRQVLKPLIDKHDGVYVKGTGDGTLSYFDSAYKASKCAKLFQESIYDNENMNVRIGIHVGDIVLDDGDVYGDGVNVASRLESMSPVGGICVSNTVYDELRNKKEFDGVELGLQSLKGVGRLIEIYGLKGDLLTEPKPSDYQDNKVAVHSDDEVPSIAIIPFDNKGADEDVYYAYGISADLISDVSSAGLIRVPSLKRVEEVSELSLDEKATKLDVRYTAEGTLWKMGDMFQLSIDLYDMKDKKVVWSDRWQEKWDNLPTIKGKLSDGLLKALDRKPDIEKNVDASNTEAYEFYLKAQYKWEQGGSGSEYINNEEQKLIRDLLIKSIELDNNLLRAKILLGQTYFFEEHGNKELALKARNIFEEVLKNAEFTNEKLYIGRSLRNLGNTYWEFDKKIANNYYLRAFEISKDITDNKGMLKSLSNIGNYHSEIGEYDKALSYYLKALKISENIDDKEEIFWQYWKIADNYQRSGDYETALSKINQIIKFLNKTHVSILNKLWCLEAVGEIYFEIGEYNKSIEYFKQSLLISKKEEVSKKEQVNHRMMHVMLNLARSYYKLEDYKQSEHNLNIILLSELNGHLWNASNLLLALINKTLGKQFDKQLINSFIKEEIEHFDYGDYYSIYELFEDYSYLKAAYKNVQEFAGTMKEEYKAKFLSYPIPSAIVEEWEKVK